MKVIKQFHVIREAGESFEAVLDQLEHAVKTARALLALDYIQQREGEPLKFLEHDYDLVLGNFGIDFLDSRPSGSGLKVDSAAGASADPVWRHPAAAER